MSDLPTPDFKCPFCQSMIQAANIKKHLLSKHNDSHTLDKYQPCQICGELLLKNKVTPHMRKMHGTVPTKKGNSNKPSKRAKS